MALQNVHFTVDRTGQNSKCQPVGKKQQSFYHRKHIVTFLLLSISKSDENITVEGLPFNPLNVRRLNLFH